jgi:hypothetical protein
VPCLLYQGSWVSIKKLDKVRDNKLEVEDIELEVTVKI